MTPDLYAETLRRLSTKAQGNVIRAAAKIDPTKDFKQVRSDLADVYAAVTTVYGEAATAQAADLYDALRAEADAAGRYTATTLNLPLEKARSNGLTVAGKELLRSGVLDIAIQNVAKSAGNQVRNTAHDTIAANINRDKSKPRYSVKLNCDLSVCHRKNKAAWWCDQVAQNVESLEAGERPDNWFHPNCPCVVEPNWTKGPKRRGGTFDKKVQWVTDEPETSGAGGGSKLPPRRGMLGPVGDDEFPKFNGYQPPARRSEIQEFTEDDAWVILYGDGSGHGHHAFSDPTPNKEKFPAGWHEEQVIQWVRAIIDAPTNAEPDYLHPGGEFILYGLHDNVYGLVAINRDGKRYFVNTAHPLER